MAITKVNITKLLIMSALIIMIILPLGSILVYMIRENPIEFMYTSEFKKAMINSILVSFTATVISVILSLILAFCVTRSNMPCKSLFNILLILPLLIPSMSHGLGLVTLLGNNGIITRLMNLSWSIYGFGGIVTGSVIYTFPIAYLMFADILRYEDTTVYEAARVLGIPRWRQFTSITLPYMRRPFIMIGFAIFTAIITDYGVPLMVGGQCTTLPVLMYHEVLGRMNFGRGSLIGIFLLLPAVISFILDILNRESNSQNFITLQYAEKKNIIISLCAFIYCTIVSIMVILPMLSSFVMTFVQRYPINMAPTLQNITTAINRGLGKNVLNSVFIAIIASIFGVIFAYFAAYFTSRTSGILTRITHLISLISIAIPGIVLGIAYVLFFKGSILSGTFSILIIVNITHFFSYIYLMAYNSLGKINENLEAVGTTLGIKRIYVIRDIIIPQTIPTIIEMSSYLFVNSMITISAVAFLQTAETRPVSLMIAVFDSQMMYESAATVSVVILLINIIMKLIFGGIKRKLYV